MQRAERRRRRRISALVAVAVAVVAVIVLAVLTLNAGKPIWAALVAAAVMAFGLLNGVYFVGKEIRAVLRGE